MPELRFFAAGKPVQQGSMNPNGHGGMYHAKGKALDDWRKGAVGDAARQAMQDNADWPRAYAGAISVGCLFRYYSKSHAEREWKISAPDLDKLKRAVLDSLTFAEVVKDDCIVCHFAETDKRWTSDPAKQGVMITVATLD